MLEKTVSWRPSPGDDTPAGSQTLRAERTKLGLVAARGTVRGKPVIFTRLRSTYFHEVDSAAGFMDFNTPTAITGPESFARAASKVGYTFNWFYADSERISYFNSGANPVRARRIDHDLPVKARYRWRRWDPDGWSSAVTPPAAHPQVVDQRFLVNWNNKQARGFAASDTNAYSSAYRSQLLSDRVRRAIRGRRKLTLPRAIDIMELAGTDDLRAHVALPLALRIIGRPKDARLRAAVQTLRAWHRAGGLRRDHDRDGVYDHGDAVALMDAWWPLWVQGAVRAGARADRAGEAALGRRARQRAEQPRRPPRLGLPGRLVRLRAQGPAHGARAQGARALRARVLRPRAVEALPARAAALAEGRARRCRARSSTAATRSAATPAAAATSGATTPCACGRSAARRSR